jgi:uncharacterized protein (TIGR02611 family)
MIRKFRAFWQRFRAARPGQRFQTIYRGRHERRTGGRSFKNIINIASGVALVIVGLILVPAPGPGWLIVALGGALLAREFLTVARFLDAFEIKLRNLIRWCKSSAKAAR